MTAAQAPKRPAMERVLATPELFELLVRDFNYKQLFGILRVDRRFRRLIFSTPRLLRAMYLQKNVSDTPNDWRLQVLNPLLHNTGEFLTLSPTGSLHFRSSCIRGANESNIFNVMCDFHSNDMDGSLVGGLSKKHPPSWTSMRVASTNVTVAITTIFGFDERQTITLSGEQTMGDVVAWLGKQKRHRAKKLSAPFTFGPVSCRQEEEKSEVETRQDMEPGDTDAMRLQAQRESSTLRLEERKVEKLRQRNEREQLGRTVTEWSEVTVPRPSTAPAQLRVVGEDEWSVWERKYILEEPDDERLRDL
ncbi:hypothetical protein Tdes44962_MAKER05917 [Teratosphaeria destructans]|uniref:Uncharacterized protein n=1 Tax=Teratosphaeria destructans TaxID=418781 RepID=A0A9W7VY56_9PEZI|nr:hypothetical protein Tdes44962_MAKER05917 [Teratosphaeria destructans]